MCPLQPDETERRTVVLLLPVSFSATPTVTSSARRPSSRLRVFTLVPSSTLARRLSSLLATSSPLASALRVPLSATSRRRLVTVARSPALPATTRPSSVTRLTRTRLVSVFPLARRRRSLALAVRPSVSLLVVAVSTSLCSRLVVRTTSSRPSATSASSPYHTVAKGC